MRRWHAPPVLCPRPGTAEVIDASVVLCAREPDHHVLIPDPAYFAVPDPPLPMIVICAEPSRRHPALAGRHTTSR